MLQDPYDSPTYTFTLAVTNTAPTFSSILVPTTLGWKTTANYTLPSYSDYEGNPISVTVLVTSSTSI